jgi:hypothetical protein
MNRAIHESRVVESTRESFAINNRMEKLHPQTSAPGVMRSCLETASNRERNVAS